MEITIKRKLLEEALCQLKAAQRDIYEQSTQNIIDEIEIVLKQPIVVGKNNQIQDFFNFFKQKFGNGFNTDILEITLKQYQETL